MYGVIFLSFVIIGVIMMLILSKAKKVGHQYAQQQKELQYFGMTVKDYYVNAWPKDKGVGECLEFNIAGVTFRSGIDNHLGEFEGRLVAEPNNQYDPNAIKILASDGHHVGYVPKDTTDEVRRLKKLPCKCYCLIYKHSDSDGTHYFTDCYIDIE